MDRQKYECDSSTNTYQFLSANLLNNSISPAQSMQWIGNDSTFLTDDFGSRICDTKRDEVTK